MWLKFKNVATVVIETFHLLLLTLILGTTFHVLQIDDIVVMASSTSTPTTTAATASTATAGQPSPSALSSSSTATLTVAGAAAPAIVGASSSTVLLSLSTLPLPQQPTTTATSLWEVETATNAGKLLNLTPSTADAITDSNEIDTMIQEQEDEEVLEEGFLDENYVMAKHIALSDDSTRIASASASVSAPAAMTTNEATLSTKLISAPATQQFAPSSPPVLLVTPSMSTTTHHRHSPAATTASLVNHRFYANKTRLDDFSSLSLLSLNDTSAELQMSTFSHSHASPSSSSSTATSYSQTTRPIQAATVLRVKGNEQNMHNTNSHLTVDNVNATIVVSGSGGTGTGEGAGTGGHTKTPSSPNLPAAVAAAHHHHRHNTTSIAGGRNHSSNSTSNSSGSSTSISIDSSDAFMTASGNIGGGGGIGTGVGSKTNGTGTTRISARKVEHKHILPKSHKTDAPMLNYIFDTFSSANKHHHHDQRYGPHFEDVQLVGKPTNMTVQAGSSIHLNCRISLLQDKTVSWVRRNPDGENALDLLTVGLHAYTGDKRYKMEFQYPNNWRLKIVNVKKDDEATYECQISTHPPRVIQINLHVNAPKVMIVDEFGDPLQEKYYEQDSTLQLSCVVRNVAMSTSVVFWKHSEDVLNYDITRGGISVKTELMDDGANSTLFIAKINKADSGNYTCSISEYQNYTIVVHILNGESFAELHHGNAICWHRPSRQSMAINLIVLATILLLLPAYVNR